MQEFVSFQAELVCLDNLVISQKCTCRFQRRHVHGSSDLRCHGISLITGTRSKKAQIMCSSSEQFFSYLLIIIFILVRFFFAKLTEGNRQYWSHLVNLCIVFFNSYASYIGRHEEYDKAKTTAKPTAQNKNHLRRENNLSVRVAHVLTVRCRKQSIAKTRSPLRQC